MQLNFVKTKYDEIRYRIEQLLNEIDSSKYRFLSEHDNIKSAKKAVEGLEVIRSSIKELNQKYVIDASMDRTINEINTLIKAEEEPIKESNYMSLDRFIP